MRGKEREEKGKEIESKREKDRERVRKIGEIWR